MRAIGIAAALLVCATQAVAGDGRIEINQDRALAGGINGSLGLDPPGFPVIITERGSYVLTGDLVVNDPNPFVLDIRSDDVTVDLNGFAIRGPQVCDDPQNCQSTGVGHAISSFNVSPIPQNTTVLNGTISGFNGCVVLAAANIHVQRLRVSHCTSAALQVGDDSLVLENRVSHVRFSGISMGTNTAFENNVVTWADLSLSGTSFAFQGGRAVGGNVCDDGSCNPNPARKRYYLTTPAYAPTAVLTACRPGFHMASLNEIHETAALTYDTTLGYIAPDSGSGPPANFGWIRTGTLSDAGLWAGTGNCNLWTSVAASDEGTIANPSSFDWALAPGERSSPWSVTLSDCDIDQRVWCAED